MFVENEVIHGKRCGEDSEVNTIRGKRSWAATKTSCELRSTSCMKLMHSLQEVYASAVVEILQSIRQAEMTPLLTRIYESDGGVELLDVLMKYLYKGMGQSAGGSTAGARNVTPQTTGFSQIQSRGGGEGGGQQMSVLLSWHEKVCQSPPS